MAPQLTSSCLGNETQGFQPLKILYLHQHFTTRQGSGGTRSFEFARLLHQRGHEITILCGRSDRSGLVSKGRLIEDCEYSGLKVLQLNVFYSQKMGFVQRLLKFVWFMLLASWVAVRQRDVDVILATSTPLTIAVPAIVASRINGLPFVFEVRDLWPDVPIGLGMLRNPVLIACARSLEHLAYRCATHIIALSPGMKDGIVRAGTPAEKVSVIPNACDNDLFDVPAAVGLGFSAQHSYLMNRPLVVYAGAFGRVNGLEYLVQLAQQVRYLDEDIVFLLVGAGREKQALHDLAQDLGVLNRTLWLMEETPRRMIPEILSAATIATSTTISNPVLWNNSANKFFDALAAGRPIAINHGGWQAELLCESGAGIVLPPDDIDQAAQLLVDFIHSEERLGRACRAARVLASERFDRRLLANQLEEVLLSVVAH
jgi:glycosyltransferase involved in cell wall biosynthesis